MAEEAWLAEGAEAVTENSIYVIRYEDRLHKVGFSNDPRSRMRFLQLGEARRLSLIRSWPRPSGDAQTVEAQAHMLLAPWRDEQPGFRERFKVGGAAACAAVELAVALVAERGKPPVAAAARLKPSEAAALNSLQAMAIDQTRMAYLRLGEGETEGEWIIAMRQLGIQPDSVFIDQGGGMQEAIALAKNMRDGDTLVVPRRSDLPASIFSSIERFGVNVVDWDLAWASDPEQVDAEVEKWNRKRAKMSAKEGQNAE